MNLPGRSAATLSALERVGTGIMIYFFLKCALECEVQEKHQSSHPPCGHLPWLGKAFRFWRPLAAGWSGSPLGELAP